MAEESEVDRLRAVIERLEIDKAKLETEKTESRRLVQATTLDELLEACHEDLFSKLTVQQNPKMRTHGTITSPRGKHCPLLLQRWKTFPSLQHEVYLKILAALQPPDAVIRRFTCLNTIRELAEMVDGLLSSEEDLKGFQHEAIERFVQLIIVHLADVESFKSYVDLGQGIAFRNQSHALSDGADEVEQRRRAQGNGPQRTDAAGNDDASMEAGASKTKAPPKKVPPPANADQLCITRKGDNTTLLFILEYKAAHKLTLQFLQKGLEKSLDVAQVRNRNSISNDPEERFIENAEELVAAAATQTYSYMLEVGLEYSCIVTGEAMVFLRIPKEEPETLYYYLAIPSQQVKKDDPPQPDYSLTAVAQLVSFAVLAYQSKERSQHWRNWAMEKCDTWAVNYDSIEEHLETPRNQRSKFSAYKGRKGTHPGRTYRTRSKRGDPDLDDDDSSQEGDESPPNPGDNHTAYNSNDDSSHNSNNNGSRTSSSDESTDVDTPNKSKSTRKNEVKSQKGGQGCSKGRAPQKREYCTQACLLGLVQKSAVDEGCPNAASHPRHKTNHGLHRLGLRKFRSLIRQQLASTLDKDCIDLKVNGARGMLFQLTLGSHGYTFVSKGTIDVFVSHLMHEGEMYRRLRSLQGIEVPVYLGNISLKRKWYAYGIRILHMLLLSYGGETVRTLDASMCTQVHDFKAKLDRFGIKHGDLRPENMLWNKELQRLVFIDFERSTMQPRPKPPLARVLGEISANKQSPSNMFRTKDWPPKKIPNMYPVPREDETSPCNNVKKAPTASYI
ncbi:MAG: hypothetical protein LQ338_004929 [Usnochroma carphineum]|nr:MAG: hypothetical protein LQ338_004929 [Usnochroma carphineum]